MCIVCDKPKGADHDGCLAIMGADLFCDRPESKGLSAKDSVLLALNGRKMELQNKFYQMGRKEALKGLSFEQFHERAALHREHQKLTIAIQMVEKL